MNINEVYWLQVESTRVYLRSTRCRGAGPCVNFRSKKKKKSVWNNLFSDC